MLGLGGASLVACGCCAGCVSPTDRGCVEGRPRLLSPLGPASLGWRPTACLFSDGHEHKVADEAIPCIRQLHRTAGAGVADRELAAREARVLKNCPEVLDAYDDVERAST